MDGKKKVVMVGMDDSECSHYALRWALQNLGQTLSRSHLLVFSAQPLLEFSCVFACSFASLNVPKQLRLVLLCSPQICLDSCGFDQRSSRKSEEGHFVSASECERYLCQAWGNVESLDNEENRGLDDSAMMLNKMTLILCSENRREQMLMSLRAQIIAEMAAEVGEPKEAIYEAAEKLDVQLLILGSHGRGAIQRAFLGSESDYCVHNAKCPVLVVKRAA